MGFTFGRAPLQNWLLYYPVERWLVQYTDALITINGEDYERADRLSKEKAAVHYVPGMGVDMKRFAPVDDKEKDRLRKAYGFTTQDFIVLCAGELNDNKIKECSSKLARRCIGIYHM